MNAQKVVIIVLVLVVVLFAVALAIGESNRRKQPPEDASTYRRPGWVGWFEGLRKPPNSNLRLERLTPGCRIGRRFVLDAGSCSVRILPTERGGISYLRLRAAGTTVEVDYEDGDEMEDVDPKALKPGESLMIPVTREGGTLILICPFGRCRVEIV